MSRIVTSKEMDELLLFCAKKGIEYLDLRLEVADHLAHSIEELWKSHPNTSFNEALNGAFKKFGIYGFTDVIEDHSNQMIKGYFRKLQETLFGLVTLKNLGVIILSAFFMWYSMEQSLMARKIFLALFYVTAIGGPLLITYLYLQHKKMFKNEKVLLLSMPLQFMVWMNWSMIYLLNWFSFDDLLISNFAIKITAVIMGLLSFYSASYKIQLGVTQELKQLKIKIAA